jgi:hypothetical protein
MTQFFKLYYELKEKWPGCPEEYYYREINQQLGYECLHPFRLLQDGPGGGYYIKELEGAYGKEWWTRIKSMGFKGVWCQVCQRWMDEVLQN